MAQKLLEEAIAEQDKGNTDRADELIRAAAKSFDFSKEEAIDLATDNFIGG